MIDKEDIKLLKNELTNTHGNFEGEVAKRTNISKTSVIRFFNGGKVKSLTGVIIYDTSLELLQEGLEEREERKKRTTRLLQKSQDLNSISHTK